jgi:hypothetical protein
VRLRSKMPEVREEDEREQMPIPLKNVSPAVPKDESKLEELIEDLRRMGCDGLLGKPWNLRSESTLREFKYERGNQWIQTFRQDPERWTAEVWARVYGFALRKGEGWANRRDSFYVGKFRGDHDPKDGFHPGNCRNPRERRVIKFILPILSPEKPKRLSITMANTLFGAMSGVQPVNWGRRLIQEYVERNIPFIGRKPSLPLYPPPLQALRMSHRSRRGRYDDSGRRSGLQFGGGSGTGRIRIGRVI